MDQFFINLFENSANNLIGIYTFCSNKDLLLNLFYSLNIIENSCPCPNCQEETSNIHSAANTYFNRLRYCTRCHTHFSLFHRTVLTRAHIDPPTFMALAYCWVNQYSLIDTCAECNVNKNTVTNFFTAFRDSVVEEVTEGPQEQIGGPNMHVEIDETVITHRKYNRGRLLNTVWAFGGICRGTDKAFALVVPDRTAPTLNDEIKKHIADGSIIHSDTWASYQQIENIPDKNFTHLSVNHSQNFVDPETGSHTQHVERMWRELKFKKIKSCGISSLDASGYVFEYIWRRNNISTLSRGQKLLRLLQTLANTDYT